MAEMKPRAALELTAQLTLNERELAALAALASYGTKAFLEAFYGRMGKAYLQPHEAGLVSLFDLARMEIPPLLAKAERARQDFKK